MRAVTHISFSLLSLGLLSGLTGIGLTTQNILCASIASILPDIDTKHSFLGRMLFPLSNFIEESLGHRTLTHSLLFVMALCIVLLPIYFFNKAAYWAIMIGYNSHLLIDCLNKTGVPFLWPNKALFVFPGKARWRIEVGSSAEYILCTFLILTTGLIFYIHSVGARSLFTNLLGTPEMAVKEYQSNADKFQMKVNVVSGFYSKEQKPVHNEAFEVVGAIDGNTLLVKHPQGYLITIGDTLKDTIQAQRESIEKIHPIKVSSDTFRFGGQKLGLMLPRVDKNTYVSGTIEGRDSPKYVKPRIRSLKQGEYESIKISLGLSEYDTQIEFNNASRKQLERFADLEVTGELVSRKISLNNEIKK